VTLSAVGCAGAPEGTVEPYNLRGVGGGGGSVVSLPPPPDICSIPEPGPIDLDTDWDGTTNLWGGRRGVVVTLKVDNADGGEIGYFGIDPAANQLVWYGVGFNYHEGQVMAMPGTCQPNSTGPHHPVINQATVGKLPQTPPQGGGERRIWNPIDCEMLRAAADAATTIQQACHY
jgi:hypothetical protein